MNVLCQKTCRKWDSEASSRLLFVFQKSLVCGKSKWSAGRFRHISITLNETYKKKKLYKTLDYWSRHMLNFDFLEKGLRIDFPPYFVFDFSRKMFLMFILSTDQVSLSNCFYFMRYWAKYVFQLFVSQFLIS